MCKVHIKLNNDNEWIPKDLKHTPSMKRNMISTRKLGYSGCLSMFGKTWWKTTKGELVITKGDMIGTLYLCPHNTNHSIFVDSTETCTTLWHHRLGHMSEKGMKILHSQKLVPYLKQVVWNYVRIVFMENKRHSNFLVFRNKRIVKSQSLCIHM